jgi:hypothetical protein
MARGLNAQMSLKLIRSSVVTLEPTGRAASLGALRLTWPGQLPGVLETSPNLFESLTATRLNYASTNTVDATSRFYRLTSP